MVYIHIYTCSTGLYIDTKSHVFSLIPCGSIVIVEPTFVSVQLLVQYLLPFCWFKL